MTYEEFWLKDHLLVESYIKKNDMDIETQTSNTWELVSYIREAILEIASNIYKDPKKQTKPHEFPKKPRKLNPFGVRHEKRNSMIAKEITHAYEEKALKYKEKHKQ